jgi:superfamily I DNA and/or RNA helicase
VVALLSVFEARGRADCVSEEESFEAPFTVGVICLYKSQVVAVRQALGDARLAAWGAHLQCSTVDAFQGAERDLVLVLTTRTRPTDHMAAPERTLVALSRARYHLVLLGDMGCLSKMPLWSRLLRDVRVFGSVQQLLTSALP